MINDLVKHTLKLVFKYFGRKPLDLLLLFLFLALAFPIWHYFGLSPAARSMFLIRIVYFVTVMVVAGLIILSVPFAMIFLWPNVKSSPTIINGIQFFTGALHLPFNGYDSSWDNLGRWFVYCASEWGQTLIID